MAATSVETARALYFPGVELKPEQHLTTRTLCVERKDVFAQLPNGFGKSIIYQAVHKIPSLVSYGEDGVVIAVSPLLHNERTDKRP